MFTEFIDRYVGLPQPELDAALRELIERRRALEAEHAALLVVADAQRAYLADGHRSMKGYLKATANCSDTDASRWRKVARMLDRHPEIGEALANARIGMAQVLELAKGYGNVRVRTDFANFLPLMLEQAEKLCFDDFRLRVNDFLETADADGAHDDRDHAVEHRNAHVVVNGSELDVSVIGGDPIVAAEVTGIFDRFAEAEFQTDVDDRLEKHGSDAAMCDLPRTPQQRRFDAFIAMARAAGASESPGDTSLAAVTVNVVIDEASFDRMLHQAGLNEELHNDLLADPADLLNRRCELADGTPVNPHDVLRAALTGHVRRVITNGAGVVINLGRRQRLFTGSAREAAMLLVRRCQHPGCDLPLKWCQVDHNREWCDGGETDQVNANPDCQHHNLEKHRKKLTLRRATNGQIYTIRSDGSIMLPVGHRPPVFDDPPETIEWMKHRIRQRVAALRPAG